MKTLINGQKIRSADMTVSYDVTFHIVRFTGKHVETLEHFNERNSVKNGVVAFATNPGCSITAAYPGKKEAMDARRVAFEASQIIEDGEIVTADGRFFKARFLGKQYSDPFAFDETDAQGVRI